ncbi:hypothetical protein QR680_000092 [Steinernema hermaphroditum]|uniref:Domain of unknown function DB domain-containing protein n=1 Tax=Steinernema hermaphroditum TaxID=289476 RepID=A0AA39GU33_9BILA|nr:hypothetical protein QR680_000092 [Steinernema hermaphroditum]
MDLLLVLLVATSVSVTRVLGQQPIYYQQPQVYYPQVQYPVLAQPQLFYTQQPQQQYPVQYAPQAQYPQQTQQPQYQQQPQPQWQQQPQPSYPQQAVPEQLDQAPPPPPPINVPVDGNSLVRRDLPPPPQDQLFPVEEVKVVRSRHRGNNRNGRRGRHQARVIDVDLKSRQNANIPNDPKTGTDEFKAPKQITRPARPPPSTTASTTLEPFVTAEAPASPVAIESSTTHAPTLAPLESVEQVTSSPQKKPNDVFLQCCTSRAVDKSCETRCNFDVLNKKVLTAMFLGTDPCPQRNGHTLLTCAAQDSDHTTCCRSKGVSKTSAGEKCLSFCQLTPGSHFQADISYLPCWGVLNDIKSCFKEAIEARLA